MESPALLTLSIFVASIILAIIGYFLKQVLNRVDTVCVQFSEYKTYIEKTFATKEDLKSHKDEIAQYQNKIQEKLIDAFVELKREVK